MIRGEHLQRDVAMQLRVMRAIDLAHATRSDPFVDRLGAYAASTERRASETRAAAPVVCTGYTNPSNNTTSVSVSSTAA
jgi:hypothetical protein